MTTDTDLVIATQKADRLIAESFPPGRPARSQEYMLGVKAALIFWLAGTRTTAPYAEGTCQFDAYSAGRQEGRTIAWREQSQ